MIPTEAQRRTLEDLIGLGPAPPFPEGLAAEVRGRLEERLAMVGAGPGRPSPGPGSDALWIGKRRLNEHARCEGLLQAGLLGEGSRFEHSFPTASGAIFHASIEVDLATERSFDPRSVCERAVIRLADRDQSFAELWRGLDGFGRGELEAEAARRLALFRDSFPPLPRRWAPQPELRLRAHLCGGRVVLAGAPDLVLGRSRRLIVDLKSGGAWPEYPEDLRFYALLLLLRTGVPPYRVATFFLESGTWQAEDVDEDVIERAADRLVGAAQASVRLMAGAEAELRAGPHCRRCPRRVECPAHAALLARAGGQGLQPVGA